MPHPPLSICVALLRSKFSIEIKLAALLARHLRHLPLWVLGHIAEHTVHAITRVENVKPRQRGLPLWASFGCKLSRNLIIYIAWSWLPYACVFARMRQGTPPAYAEISPDVPASSLTVDISVLLALYLCKLNRLHIDLALYSTEIVLCSLFLDETALCRPTGSEHIMGRAQLEAAMFSCSMGTPHRMEMRGLLHFWSA